MPMETWHRFLKNALWANLGVFFGQTLFRVWEYHTHRDRLALQSAPWYLSIQISAVVTTLLASGLLLAMYLVGRKLGKPTSLFRLGSQVSTLIALCACIWMGFEIFGYHTDYDMVAVEATVVGVCLAVNLVCAVLRCCQEKKEP